jgi:putative ABC transport system substrate-binding protein
MRRRDIAIGLLLATAVGKARAQERAMQHRIAIAIPAGPVALISETGNRYWPAFFEELRRLGDVEGQPNPNRRAVFRRRAARGLCRPRSRGRQAEPGRDRCHYQRRRAGGRAATGTIPIVWIGIEPIRAGLVTSLARPGGNITGVTAYDLELFGKLLQLLKEAVPSASKVAFLNVRAGYSQPFQQPLREISQQLEISLIDMALHESTLSEYQRVFAEIARQRFDGILVSDIPDLIPYRELIIELVEKSRLPAIYGYREFVEAGGLLAYGADLGEQGRRLADDVHQILNGAEPGDIPIYQSTRFSLVINLKAADAISLTLPPALLARADEVIE